jgi:hypothetical protein
MKSSSSSPPASGEVRLIYNAIINGNWYAIGDPIPKAILPAGFRKYIAKPSTASASQERNLRYLPNELYSIDSEGNRLSNRAVNAKQRNLTPKPILS